MQGDGRGLHRFGRSWAGPAMLAGLLLAALAAGGPWAGRLDGWHADRRQQLLRQLAPPRPFPGPSPVIVGIDEGDLRHFPEPSALWHRHFAAFVAAAERGGARAVVFDVVLPDRDYATVVADIDQDLLRALLAARQRTPVVLARTLDRDGRPRPLARRMEVIAGADGIGLALFPRDADGVVRRFDERLADDDGMVPTLAGQVARRLGIEPVPGWIDFSRGEPFDYVSLREVLAWGDDGTKLRAAFAGRVVLLGSVLWHEDAVAQPLSLAGWTGAGEPPPGVLLQAQALRNLLDGGLLRPAPGWLPALLALFGAALAWAATTPSRALLLAIAWTLVLATGAAFAWRAGWAVATAVPWLAGVAALAMRGFADAAVRLRERRVLRRAFAASVSPAVLETLLAGTLQPALGGERRFLCLLFSDIRGFTTRSESTSPEQAIALLNRYFERVVAAIHREDGTVLNFMGDGIMAMFGAPQALDRPCDAALRAARAMQAEMARLNAELAAEGQAAIETGIGLHAGDAVVGFVGAVERNDYTAIGDACNVASRVEGLTKELGFPVLLTEAVRARLTDADGLVPLGQRAIKGHSSVQVHGWMPDAGEKAA